MAAGERRDFFTFKSKLHDVYTKHVVMIKGLLFLTPQKLYLGDTLTLSFTRLTPRLMLNML
ncbi:unnamed protein product [Acanthoscelides obtectus]|uniref:Uncharacterized protein n=1 Tax=Acanthoscelides obtectus TaxID=200917 RepID=A0A9P0MCP1_ACAOB|nr:unnamed protein product [Acanthoscelides obtectus]CAK1624254.1 hypothetical protein AOBTE_LOCUS2443 [Acanthoscelides obtectus]